MLLSSKLGVGCSVDCGCMVCKHEDLALWFLCCDSRYHPVEPRDVGLVCGNVGIGSKALDSLEVLQRPGEDIEVLWVKGGPEGAPQDRDRWREVVACLV